MKLTNYYREEAFKILIKKRVEELKKQSEPIAKLIVKDFEATLDKSLIKAFKANRSFFDSFKFYVRVRYFADVKADLPMPKHASYFFDKIDRRSTPFLSEQTLEALKTWLNKEEELKSHLQQLESALTKYTTSNKLIEDFPETDILFNNENKAALPMIPVQEIRGKLGLKQIKQDK